MCKRAAIWTSGSTFSPIFRTLRGGIFVLLPLLFCARYWAPGWMLGAIFIRVLGRPLFVFS